MDFQLSTILLLKIIFYILKTGITYYLWQSMGKGGTSLKQTKNEFFMLIKSYNLSQLSAKILEGKTFPLQRNWQLNWAVFSKAIKLQIEKT